MRSRSPGSARPLIGLSPDFSAANSGTSAQRFSLDAASCDAVLAAGGLPLMLVPTSEPPLLEAWVDRISALVITGGDFDVPPALYGEEPKEGLRRVLPERTRFERSLLELALARDLPVLGICGGMQLLNVVRGGNLIQDLRSEAPDGLQHEQGSDSSQPRHPVEVKDETRLAELLGKGQVMVNSTHHQAVGRLGSGLVASASAPDGVVEAVELPEQTFTLGVQWHPERLIHSLPHHLAIFRALVEHARDRHR